jgi:hypothetical protein
MFIAGIFASPRGPPVHSARKRNWLYKSLHTRAIDSLVAIT